MMRITTEPAPPPEESTRSKAILATGMTTVTTSLGTTSGILLSLKSGTSLVIGGLIGGGSGCFTGLCCFFSVHLIKKYFIDERPGRRAQPATQLMEIPVTRSEQQSTTGNIPGTLFAQNSAAEGIDAEELEHKYDFK